MNRAKRNYNKMQITSQRNANSQLENYTNSIDKEGSNWYLSQNDLEKIGIFNSVEGGKGLNLEEIQHARVKVKDRLNKTTSIRNRRSLYSNQKVKIWLSGMKKNP